MRFMLIVKANPQSEAGEMPRPELISAMMKFNQEMMDAGALLSLDGLQASSKGARVSVRNGQTVVTDGPFAETRELIAGFWLIRAESLEQAIAWASRAPIVSGEHALEGDTIEVRKVFELDDFELGEAEQEVREFERNLTGQQESE